MQIHPQALYNNTQIRQFETVAMQEFDISQQQLMESAGQATFSVMMETWADAERVVVLCGPGNNGGDGYVCACLAKQAGLEVSVYYLGDFSALSGAAEIAAQTCQKMAVPISEFNELADLQADVIIDALIGTGLQRDVEGVWQAAIDQVNELDIPVLSVDVPSGLDSDTGCVLGSAIVADQTISFIAAKCGLFTAEARDYTGEIFIDDLNIPEQVIAQQVEKAFILDLSELSQYLGSRSRVAHKSDFGHVLVIGGNYGMSGAVRMAAEAAYRVGAGLVSVATRAVHVSVVSGARPEIMCHGIEQAAELLPLIEKASLIIIGPGLGQDDWAQQLFAEVITKDLPLVIDADGLNLLAKNPCELRNAILTPHPGEAARLLNVEIPEIEQQRYVAIENLYQCYRSAIVLKGAGTLVLGSEEMTGVCVEGNPGMASGGMGDVLSGVIGGLVAQQLPLQLAAQLGVCLHAGAGDLAAKQGERGLLATDLLSHIRHLINRW